MTTANNVTSIFDRLAAYDADPAPKKGIELLDLPQVIRLSEVEPKPIDWLWPGWLPKGMLTILGGFAGDGKSTLTLALAAAFSNGSPLPDGSVAPITNTLLLEAEDDLEHVVAPLLALHDADRERIITPTGRASDGVTPHMIDLKTDVPRLRQLIVNNHIGLLVIDPISSYLPSGDRNSEGDVLSWKKPPPQQEKGSEERDAAAKFLYKFLAGGMKSPIEIEREGLKEGHTKRILRRAKEDMELQSIKVKDRWFWSLPMD